MTGTVVEILDRRVLGGFNRSSQHVTIGAWFEVEQASAASCGESDARQDLVAGATVGSAARGPCPVLAIDRGWCVERGLGRCSGGVIRGWM
jgi:hypothetical protein